MDTNVWVSVWEILVFWGIFWYVLNGWYLESNIIDFNELRNRHQNLHKNLSNFNYLFILLLFHLIFLPCVNICPAQYLFFLSPIDISMISSSKFNTSCKPSCLSSIKVCTKTNDNLTTFFCHWNFLSQFYVGWTMMKICSPTNCPSP